MKRDADEISCGSCVDVNTITKKEEREEWSCEPRIKRQKTEFLKCSQCNEIYGTESYSRKQRKCDLDRIRCMSCTKDAISSLSKFERQCVRCRMVLPRDSFSTSKLKGPVKKLKCKTCVQEDKPISRKPTNREINVNETNNHNNEEKSPSGKNGRKSIEKSQKKFVTDKEEIKAILKERLNVMPLGQTQKSFSLRWNSSSISQTDEKNAATKVLEKGDYGPIDETLKTHILKIIESSSSSMTLSQVISLRAALLQQKAMFHHGKLLRKSEKLYKEYKAGKSIVDLARDVDCPPLNVFRIILKNMHLGKAQIKKCLNNPEVLLRKREQEELKAAVDMDITAQFDQAHSLKVANDFEDIIADFLQEKGVTFVRQEQLTEEQMEVFGTTVLTPDFLLLDELKINETRVNWIDAKAFYGANTPMNIKTFKKQMSRYTNHWGEGAVVYLDGFSEMLKLEKCTMLTAQGVLDVDSLPVY